MVTVAVVATVVGLTIEAFPSAADDAVRVTTDAGGPDDTGGPSAQSDLNSLAVDYSHLDSDGRADIYWNWDETAWTGANTGDACALVDNDGDGNANYALCVTVYGSPAAQFGDSPRLYSCGDARIDRCAQPITRITPISSTCTAAVEAGVDPFHAGLDDTVASCNLFTSDLSGAPVHTNVCAYNSEQPNSDPSDCILAPGVGILVQNNVGSDTTTPFVYEMRDSDGVLIRTLTVTGTGTSAFTALANDNRTYSITLVSPTGWRTVSSGCDDATADPPSAVTLTTADTGAVTCTFEHEPIPVADVSLTKADAADPLLSGGSQTYTLTVTNDGPDVAENVVVTDAKPAGFTVDSVTPDVGTCVVDTDVVCQLGDIPFGDSVDIVIEGTVDPDLSPGTLTNIASVTTDSVDETPDNDSASEETEVIDELVSVTKEADTGSVDEPGGDVTFTFGVTNEIDEPVDLTALTDSVFGDLNGQGTCSVPQTIGVGSSYQCELTETIAGQAGDAHNDTVTAQATVGGTTDEATSEEVQVDVADVPSQLLVTKTADVGSVTEPGGDVTFTFEVENASPADSVRVDTVVDDVYGDLSGDCDATLPVDLAPSQVLTCSITETIEGNAGDVHTNTVTVTGEDDDGVDLEETDDEQVTVLDDLSSGISVTKTADVDELASPGGEVTFTVEVLNESLVDDVTLSSIVDSTAGGPIDLATQCGFPVTVEPGDTVTCTFTRQVTGDPGDVDQDAVTVSGLDDDGNPVGAAGSESVDLIAVNDLTIDKRNTSASVVTPGQPFSYDLVVANHGPSATASDTRVVDILPAGTALVSASGTGWDCTASVVGAVDCTSGDQVALDGDFPTITVVVATETDLTGDVTNTAAVSNPDDPAGPDDDELVTPSQPLADLDLTKALTGSSSVSLGDEVEYLLTLTNDGPSHAQDIEVSEELPDGLAFVDAQPTIGSFAESGNGGVWTVEDLAVGETAELVLHATVQRGTSYRNVAFVSSAGQPDPDSTVAGQYEEDGEDDEAAAEELSVADDPPPDDPADPADPAAPGPSTDGGDLLPRTGAEMLRLLVIGLVLVLGGVALRRRGLRDPVAGTHS